MRLLICTQKVDINDDNLGFFHDWIKEFAKHCEKVTVICLNKGKYNLPNNVKVLSLGKEYYTKSQYPISNIQFPKRFKFIVRFYVNILKYRKDYDSVFVHMNPEYVVLAGWYWRLSGKKLGLWFTHKAVQPSLWIAEKFANVIFTASKESFRLKSKKVRVVGHGINLEKYRQISDIRYQISESFKIIAIGRISPSKDYETLIRAIEVLKNKGKFKEIEVKIIGGPGTVEQEKYYKNLKDMVKEKGLDDIIEFIGPVPASEIPAYYQGANLFVHTSRTGSLDKVVLEAMASGLPVLSSNKAVLNDVLADYKDELGFKEGNAEELAEKISQVWGWGMDKRNKLGEEMRRVVAKEHGLDKLITNLLWSF